MERRHKGKRWKSIGLKGTDHLFVVCFLCFLVLVVFFSFSSSSFSSFWLSSLCLPLHLFRRSPHLYVCCRYPCPPCPPSSLLPLLSRPPHPRRHSSSRRPRHLPSPCLCSHSPPSRLPRPRHPLPHPPPPTLTRVKKLSQWSQTWTGSERSELGNYFASAS